MEPFYNSEQICDCRNSSIDMAILTAPLLLQTPVNELHYFETKRHTRLLFFIDLKNKKCKTQLFFDSF